MITDSICSQDGENSRLSWSSRGLIHNFRLPFYPWAPSCSSSVSVSQSNQEKISGLKFQISSLSAFLTLPSSLAFDSFSFISTFAGTKYAIFSFEKILSYDNEVQ
ncbi:hypothetical protein SLEP1_g58518 [Rubroshorea leprosula]|uniref:Uncharacterized protein n=1 Tax=Rubroshorea leprosula TaxID=152421 RepID=A0AAV5MQQ9_9ROSI|nr:hypothetical protein SLEP1_g58518 [Rubroshorea leprosula]